MHEPCLTQEEPAVEDRGFPPPFIPLAPTLSRDGIGRSRETVPSILDLPHQLKVTSGRVAIALALRHAGIGTNDDVLVPAYHCDSMVAPVRLEGARTEFYRVDECGKVDFADLASKAGPATKALILTHFFGFPQDLERARAFCDKHSLILIEDCAHTFFGEWNGKAVGSVGDYAIASSMKFFPVFDGGVLASRSRDLTSIELRSPSIAFELKALSNIVERALQYDRLTAVASMVRFAMRAKDKIWKLVKSSSKTLSEARLTPGSSEGGYVLDPEWLDVRMSRVSSTILRFSNFSKVVEDRRANYRALCQRLSKLPGLHPLHPQLPDGVVPLNLPVLVDDAETLFPLLKRAGIPIWRFGEYLDDAVTSDVCANSCHLSGHVFQFPCHSELRPAEIDWMVDTIRLHLAQLDNGKVALGAP